MSPPRGAVVALKLAAVLVVGFCAVAPKLPPSTLTAVDPASGGPILFMRSHGVRGPLHLAWAVEGLRAVPRGLLVFAGACVAMLVALPARWVRGPARWPDLSGAGRVAPLLALLAASALFWLLRVDPARNARFGDGPTLPVEVERGMIFATEVASMRLFAAARWLRVGLLGDGGGQGAIAAVSVACGGGFAAAVATLARAVGRRPWERWTLFAGIALVGAAVAFCGYVETTQVELAAMAAYLGLAARAVLGDDRRPLSPARLGALAAVGLAITAHAAGLLLLPSLLFLFAPLGDGVTGRLRAALAPRAAAAWLLLVVLPWVALVGVPFVLRGDLGNAAGGGDGIMFVPFAWDERRLASPYVIYALGSRWHLADLANAMLLGAPFALPLTAAGLWMARRRPGCPRERQLLLLLGTAAAGCAVVPLAWNHDYGMWGDWNLATCYLFPLHALGWLAWVMAVRRLDPPPGLHATLTLPLVTVQVLAAAGIWLQLR